MGNKISLDQINARLSNSGSSRIESGFTDQEVYGDDEDNGSMGAGFIALMVASFLGIGAGTFWYMGGVETFFSGSGTAAQVAETSSIAKRCSQGWVEAAPNDDALHCMLTTDPTRFCAEKGKSDFRQFMVRYYSDYQKYQVAVAEQKAKGALNMMGGGGMKIALDQAKISQAASNPNLSDEEKAKMMGDLMGNVDKVWNGDGSLRDRAKSKVGTKAVMQAVQGVVEKGFLSSDEFGQKPPKVIVKALDDVKAVYDYCPKSIG